LIDAVAASNVAHQRAITGRLATLLGDAGAPGRPAGLRDRRVALFGLAFKANTDDVRRSPALAIAAELRAAGATVTATDPRAASNAVRSDPDLVVAESPIAAATGADAVLVVTEWAEYRALDWRGIAGVMRGDLVYDTRAIADTDAVAAAGLRLERLGRR
jgi:UDPglucose 6-dehydrogenase